MKKGIFLFISCFIFMFLGACQNVDNQSEEKEQTEAEIEEASSIPQKVIEVDLKNRNGERTGFAELREEDEGVKIHLEAWGLSPGVHGIHIHERGICEEPSFESAGGHFNPTDRKHGFDHPEGPHAGDLPNIEVQADGTISATILGENVTLEKGKDHSLLQEDGTSLVIHEDPDDYISQPAGNAGERIACGVIEER